MIKKCLSCEFSTDDSSADACPVCFRTLVTSLLESNGPDGEPEALEAEPAPLPVWRASSYTVGPSPQGIWEILSDNGLGWVLLFLLVIIASVATSSWLTS